MLSARLELATFHLGGERSIQLSYESRIIFDFRFAVYDCPIRFTNRIAKANLFRNPLIFRVH